MPYYFIKTPELTMSFIGVKQDSEKPDHVWLCKPDGEPVFEVKSKYVTDSSPERMASLMAEDVKWARRERKQKWN